MSETPNIPRFPGDVIVDASHGIIMALLWLLVAPVAVIIMRYRLLGPKSFVVHRGMMTVVALGTLTSWTIAYVSTELHGGEHFAEGHPTFGTYLTGLVLLQLTWGYFMRTTVWGEKYIKVAKWAHRIMGAFILIMPLFIIGYGLYRIRAKTGVDTSYLIAVYPYIRNTLVGLFVAVALYFEIARFTRSTYATRVGSVLTAGLAEEAGERADEQRPLLTGE
ncbi:hypothetical protein HDU93_003431 [Gonapodya sp. JEL0774]|nr:hypothetical protein HDU93_003431 [Gonapodya sp. JEL0774]